MDYFDLLNVNFNYYSTADNLARSKNLGKQVEYSIENMDF